MRASVFLALEEQDGAEVGIFLFHILHNALTAITILTYNTNNAYYTNHIYNVQNQNVHTTTTKKQYTFAQK